MVIINTKERRTTKEPGKRNTTRKTLSANISKPESEYISREQAGKLVSYAVSNSNSNERKGSQPGFKVLMATGVVLFQTPS